MAQENQKLESARALTEQVMQEANINDPTHKLASAVHLVLEVLSTAPELPKPEDMRAQIQAAAEKIAAARIAELPQPQQSGLIEAAPPARSLPSVPPGTYEAARNEDGTVATNTPAAQAASGYESRRNEDGTAG